MKYCEALIVYNKSKFQHDIFLVTCVVGVVLSAALMDDQTSLEELQEARRFFSLSHQHLESHPQRKM